MTGISTGKDKELNTDRVNVFPFVFTCTDCAVAASAALVTTHLFHSSL